MMGSLEGNEDPSKLLRRRMEEQYRPPNINIDNSATNGNTVRRTTSSMWDKEFDPFQVFEVEHEACFHLTVTVHNGEGITKGLIKDKLDPPDPYLILKIPGSSNSSKTTSVICNNPCPIWNETFNFFLEPSKVNSTNDDQNTSSLNLVITLMEANTFFDEVLGEDSLPISSLKEGDEKDHIFTFVKTSKIYTTVRLQKNKVPDLRFSLSLCEEEKNFLRLRRERVRLVMNEILGDKGPKTKEEVPIMAILGSGGGFRAMICLSGVIRALHKSKIMNCATFISGLSGSSWLISTLYAHDKFPHLTYDEIYEELKESVTGGWMSYLFSFEYAGSIFKKYKEGQPISFTDIFGHLLGDVLLKGKKEKKLTDQQSIVKQGTVPFPLYTCLHAKDTVSCKSFSEWVEFSPFEIGIAKYGTFMKTADFGSKFIVGKIIKRFSEFPLHYLQGVWGSAFTILLKRLRQRKGSGGDMVQMMREANEERAIFEQLEFGEGSQEAEQESDTDVEEEIERKDDIKTSSSEEEEESVGHKKLVRQDATNIPPSPSDPEAKDSKGGLVSYLCNRFDPKGKNDEEKKNNRKTSEDESKKKSKLNMKAASMGLSKESVNYHESASKTKSKSLDQTAELEKTTFSFDFIAKDNTQRKISTQSDPGFMSTTNLEARKKRQLERQGAIRNQKSTTSEPDRCRKKRELRQSKRGNKNLILQYLSMGNSNILNSRVGRAGEILNPFRGLSLRNSFPLSPFWDSGEDFYSIDSDEITGIGCRNDPLDSSAKRLFIVDSGLAFNSPYPLLLRPQRAVDIYLSFDFSQRDSDKTMPFKELLIAEHWAKQNRVRFPPIEKMVNEEFSKDPEIKEVYVFEDPKDPLCPIVLHFPLVNNNFKRYKEPGVRRETKEEFEFADFPIFDETQTFSSTNFTYTEKQYERLVKLMEFNTSFCLDTIKENLIKVVEKKSDPSRILAKQVNRVRLALKTWSRFKLQEGLKLKINEREGKMLMNALKPNLMKKSSDSGNSSGEEDYEDAQDSILEESEEELYTPPITFDDYKML